MIINALKTVVAVTVGVFAYALITVAAFSVLLVSPFIKKETKQNG